MNVSELECNAVSALLQDENVGSQVNYTRGRGWVWAEPLRFCFGVNRGRSSHRLLLQQQFTWDLGGREMRSGWQSQRGRGQGSRSRH